MVDRVPLSNTPSALLPTDEWEWRGPPVQVSYGAPGTCKRLSMVSEVISLSQTCGAGNAAGIKNSFYPKEMNNDSLVSTWTRKRSQLSELGWV